MFVLVKIKLDVSASASVTLKRELGILGTFRLGHKEGGLSVLHIQWSERNQNNIILWGLALWKRFDTILTFFAMPSFIFETGKIKFDHKST